MTRCISEITMLFDVLDSYHFVDMILNPFPLYAIIFHQKIPRSWQFFYLKQQDEKNIFGRTISITWTFVKPLQDHCKREKKKCARHFRN